ncbi:MAG: biotin/lipoate A/B protein ligase family protein [Candidatus Aenigmatarchaeota archaeon]
MPRNAMKQWRLLETIEASGSRQMAIDEAMLVARSEGKIPNTLRFFKWKPPAITIGFFQSLEKEVDVKKANSLGVDVIRRYTGGGAVLHDKEITYSLVVGEDEMPTDIIESYELICQGIVSGLALLGIDAEFRPINDIVTNGKKISGNAQTRKQGVLLQHGTLILDVDVKKMFSLLKVPDEKIRDKMISAVEERVTSVRKEIGHEISFEEIQEALTNGFQDVLKTNFIVSGLTECENQLAKKLEQEKYSAKNWNHWR